MLLPLTAVSMSAPQKRSVILWSLRDVLPADSFGVQSVPVRKSGSRGGGGALVVVYVDCGGRIVCGCAINGWVRATESWVLLSKQARNENGNTGGTLQPNPSPVGYPLSMIPLPWFV